MGNCFGRPGSQADGSRAVPHGGGSNQNVGAAGEERNGKHQGEVLEEVNNSLGPNSTVFRKKKVQQPLSKLVKDKLYTEIYKPGKKLGQGGFAEVRLVTHRQSNETFACKIMDLPPEGAKVDENQNSREDIFQEIEILCQLEHRNVLHLIEYYTSDSHVYIITELLSGGELLDAVVEKGSYSEADARMCFTQLLEGLDYLHKHQIVHRDIKLDNLLLVKARDISQIKIADFGLAKQEQMGQFATVCGTPQYVAPEVLEQKVGQYDYKVDMWSAGCILYILLGGYPPFYDANQNKLFHLIRKGTYNFNDPMWAEVSEDAKSLIRSLLTVNPAQRPSAQEALQHPWLRGEVPTSTLPGVQQNIKNNFKRFKRTADLVIALERMRRMATSTQERRLSQLQTDDGGVPAKVQSSLEREEEGVVEG